MRRGQMYCTRVWWALVAVFLRAALPSWWLVWQAGGGALLWQLERGGVIRLMTIAAILGDDERCAVGMNRKVREGAVSDTCG